MPDTPEQQDDETADGHEDRQAHERERLLLGAESRYTKRDIAELAGVSLEHAARLWQSLGFAVPGDDDVVFTDADVEALRMVTGLQQAGIIDPATEQALTRALSQAMARLAEWQVDILQGVVTAHSPDPHDPESVRSARLATAEWLVPGMERLQQYVWRRHLLAVAERTLGDDEHEPNETAMQAVGFADIVGFTSLSGGLDQATLAEFLEEFESTTSAVVADHGGRVIKTLGDEIMFMADDPRTAADIGLDFADRISSLDGRPDLRIGLAYGPVLRRLGDAYGSVVNLASRLTNLARPGSVLADRELATAVLGTSRYRLKRLRRVSVRGFENLQPWLLRRRATTTADHGQG